MQAEAVADAVALAFSSALSPVLARLAAVETRLVELGTLAKDVGTLRERVAAVEVKPLLAGPAGTDGHDGAAGRDGLDGLGVDDLVVERHDARSWEVVAVRDGRRKSAGVIVLEGVPRYQGVYRDGEAYTPGDLVTWGGSLWHCDAATHSRPESAIGAKVWTLAVKRGRDGRDRREP
jgi:hypothetical protein